jgi:TIGR03009 family protein
MDSLRDIVSPLQFVASGKMLMLGRIVKPITAWSVITLAAFAQQQPRNNQSQPPSDRFQQNAQQYPSSGNRVPAQPTSAKNTVTGNNGATAQPSGGQFQPGQMVNGQAPNGQPQNGPQFNVQPLNTPVGNQGQAEADRRMQEFQQQLIAQQKAKQTELAKMPFPPLNQLQQEYLDKVLDVWEKRTATYTQYECSFSKFTYDPTQNADPDPVSKASGTLRYMAPDKGMFRVDNIEFFVSREAATGKAQYRVNEREKFGDYWICDGQYIHILNRNDKKAMKVQLPPNMQGQNIRMSPLPFLFGVKANEITNRYWVRPVEPPKGSKDVVLETFPKHMDDAANYSRVQVFLDPVEVLPKALIVFLPNWRPDQPHQEIYEFKNAKKNFSGLANALKKAFADEFIPSIPKDWQVEEVPYEGDTQPAGNQANAPQAPARTAQPPASQPRR